MKPSTRRLDRATFPATASLLTSALLEQTGAASTHDAICRLTTNLLVATGQRTPETRLSSLARYLGAEISYDDNLEFGSQEAALVVKRGKFFLQVSRQQFERNPLRARFSIAHEIGHLLLMQAVGLEVSNLAEQEPNQYDQIERLCDLVASHLLLPRNRLSEAVRSTGLTSNGIAKVAKVFNVSHGVTLRAIPDLVPDGGLIIWRKSRRNKAEPVVWRVYRCYLSSGSENYNSWLPYGCTQKHLRRLGDLDDLHPDEQVVKRNVMLSRGRKNFDRDAILCLWCPTSSAQQQLLEIESRGWREDLQAPPAEVLVLVGRSGHCDFRQFGATAP